MFGGESNRRTSYEETWTFDVQAREWEQVGPETHPVDAGGITAASEAWESLEPGG